MKKDLPCVSFEMCFIVLEQRKSTREKASVSFSDEMKYLRMIESKQFAEHSFPRVKGHQVTLAWMKKGFSVPVIIEESNGLEMHMPPKSLSVSFLIVLMR